MGKLGQPDGTYILRWGAHKNKEVGDISSNYLQWLAKNCTWDDDAVEAAEAELSYRDTWNQHWYD